MQPMLFIRVYCLHAVGRISLAARKLPLGPTILTGMPGGQVVVEAVNSRYRCAASAGELNTQLAGWGPTAD